MTRFCCYIEAASEYLEQHNPDILERVRMFDIAQPMAAVLGVWRATVLAYSSGFAKYGERVHTTKEPFDVLKMREKVAPYLVVDEGSFSAFLTPTDELQRHHHEHHSSRGLQLQVCFVRAAVFALTVFFLQPTGSKQDPKMDNRNIRQLSVCLWLQSRHGKTRCLRSGRCQGLSFFTIAYECQSPKGCRSGRGQERTGSESKSCACSSQSPKGCRGGRGSESKSSACPSQGLSFSTTGHSLTNAKVPDDQEDDEEDEDEDEDEEDDDDGQDAPDDALSYEQLVEELNKVQKLYRWNMPMEAGRSGGGNSKADRMRNTAASLSSILAQSSNPREQLSKEDRDVLLYNIKEGQTLLMNVDGKAGRKVKLQMHAKVPDLLVRSRFF
jgi:hypothetical protein